MGAAAAHVLMNLGRNDRNDASPSNSRKRPMQHSDSVPEDLTAQRVGDMSLNSPNNPVQMQNSNSNNNKRVRPSLVQDSDSAFPHSNLHMASSRGTVTPDAAAMTTATVFADANLMTAKSASAALPEVSSSVVDISGTYCNTIQTPRGGNSLHMGMSHNNHPHRFRHSHEDAAPMTPAMVRSPMQDDSDSDSSSCKDVEDPGVVAPDSVPAMVAEIRKLLDYVASKPTLQCGSASFMRDYLRTMLIQSATAAEEAIASAAKAAKDSNRAGGFGSDLIPGSVHASFFKALPDELSKHIFSFLDGKHLAMAREVHPKWNEFACEEHLWRALCLSRWRSLETDQDLWKLIDKNVAVDAPQRWRKIYPTINKHAQWPCRLQKTGRFICNLIAHQISGAPLGPNGLPKILVVERRFNILHLQTFVLPDASVLYFEPEQDSDRAGFNDFIEYLTKRTRAGLALEDQRRFIFIPPCDYTRTHVGYAGLSLLGVVQNAYPPLAP